MSDTSSPSAVRAWADWAQSAVNGLWGDSLLAADNGLAIRMAFYTGGQPQPISREALALMQPPPTSRLCVLVHGLGCNESAWRFRAAHRPETETTYAHLLHAEMGFTPFCVRYNTGLSVAENGLALAALLDTLLHHYPLRVEEIVLVGHSMGGLVLRSACHDAVLSHAEWVRRVTRVFYLGTPHDGADLERLAHAASTALAAVPNPVTRLLGRVLELRSQGVRDLRYGSRLASHHVTDDSTPDPALQQEIAQPIPWLATARHYFISGVVTRNPEHIAGVILGDGLVRPISPRAVGHGAARLESDTPLYTASKVLPGVHHLGLMRDPRVYEQIRDWCVEE